MIEWSDIKDFWLPKRPKTNFLLMVYNYPFGLFSSKEKAMEAGLKSGNDRSFVIWECDVDNVDNNNWHIEYSVDNNWTGWKRFPSREYKR